MVTVFVAVENRSKTDTIVFIIISSVVTMIWFIVTFILIAGKRRKDQKNQDLESLELLNRRKAETSDRADQKEANQAITSVATNGFSLNKTQFEAFESIFIDMKGAVDASVDRDEIREKEQKKLDQKIEKMSDRVDNLAFQILKSNQSKAPNNLESSFNCSKSLSAIPLEL